MHAERVIIRMPGWCSGSGGVGRALGAMPGLCCGIESTMAHHDASNRCFESELRTTLSGFRAALCDACTAAGSDLTRPQQLGRDLDLDKSLAWHLSKIGAAEDPIAAAPHMPGRAGLRIVRTAIRRSGAPQATATRLDDAIARFERLVDEHCGDRKTFKIMASHLIGGDPGTAVAQERQHRKQLFEGASGVWGVKARLQIAACFAFPSDVPDHVDFATISGLVDLQRLREDVSWSIASLRAYHADGIPRENESSLITPLDERVEPGAVPLMRDFCSEPVPHLERRTSPDGMIRFEIVDGPVGALGAATCVSAWHTRARVPAFRTGDDRFGEYLVHLHTPVEFAVDDLFIHADLPFGTPPKASLHSQLPGGPVYPHSGRDRGRLPMAEPLVRLGNRPPDVTLTEFPSYRRLTEQVVDALGFELGDFAGYRVRVRYPPIPAVLVLRHELPDPPGGTHRTASSPGETAST